MESVKPFREALCRRIGFPPHGSIGNAEPRYEHVADDGYASILRMKLEVPKAVVVYGILMIPKSVRKPAPLLITYMEVAGALRL